MSGATATLWRTFAVVGTGNTVAGIVWSAGFVGLYLPTVPSTIPDEGGPAALSCEYSACCG